MLLSSLSSRSGVPPYLQIVQQIRQALVDGVLRPGDRLPTVKDVVGQLTVNPNTVLKAYRELEAMGLVEGRQGVGTFALKRPAGPPASAIAPLARALGRWVDKARMAGLDDEDMHGMLRAVVSARAEAETA